MFYSDKPIVSEKDDLLKRSGFSRLLAKTILELKEEETFTIGLYGEWGSGKTSVVKMVEESLEKQQIDVPDADKIRVLHFEPWNISDSNQLMSQFLIRLANEFKKEKGGKLSAIGEALMNYSNAFALDELISDLSLKRKIIATLGRGSMFLLGRFFKIKASSNDIQHKKNEVTKLLEEQSNKILVVIDDIDRLSNEQIRQVFQLVTSVAKFPNMIYLLVFDKDIVVRALEKIQEGNGDDYLEKVIQMPIHIPNMQKSELRNILFERLDGIQDNYSSTVFSQNRWRRLFGPCVEDHIVDIRDINRLCNMIEFKLAALHDEVNLEDLIALTSIEIGNPQLYEWIKDNRYILTGYGYDTSYDLFNYKNRTQKEWYDFYEQMLIDYMCCDKNNTNSVIQVHNSMRILAALFPYFGTKIGRSSDVYQLDQLRKNNQVAHPDKFDRYFHLTVDYISSKHSEVMDTIHQKNAEEIVLLMRLKNYQNTCYDFVEEIRAYIYDISAERAKVIIEAFSSIAYKLDTLKNGSLLSLSTKDCTISVIYKLFSRISSEQRLDYFKELIDNAIYQQLPVIAEIINMLELGYGRLAANGVERVEYDKFLDIDALEKIEDSFMKKIQSTFIETNLFDFEEWRFILYLIENFDNEYAIDYLNESFIKDDNILKFLNGSTARWHGRGTTYQFKDDYKKYVSDERVLNAINKLKENGDLFKLPIEVQRSSSAFCICLKVEQNDDHDITQEAVDNVLARWEQEFNIKSTKNCATMLTNI